MDDLEINAAAVIEMWFTQRIIWRQRQSNNCPLPVKIAADIGGSTGQWWWWCWIIWVWVGRCQRQWFRLIWWWPCKVGAHQLLHDVVRLA